MANTTGWWWYDNFLSDYQDPYTKGWFLTGTPIELILILISYVYLSTKIGPQLMKNIEPFKLTRTIQFYNLVQIALNIFILYEGVQSGMFSTYNYTCSVMDYSGSESSMRLRRATWIYYMVKLLDLADTLFFILRKKYNQVTYLHIYHHTLMPLCGYIGTTYLPGGHGILMGFVNSFIHVILYTYYLIATFPTLQKFLWWKKYVTVLQLIQFSIIFIHNLQVLPRQCNYPKVINLLLLIESGYFSYLFGSFYITAYIYKKPQKTIISSKLDYTNGTVKNNMNDETKNGKAKIY